MRLILVEDADLAAAVMVLKSLSPAARRLLAECVEHQGVTRQKASAAALALENVGFVRIRGGDFLDPTIEILPSLAGEEALEALDEERETPALSKGRQSS